MLESAHKPSPGFLAARRSTAALLTILLACPTAIPALQAGRAGRDGVQASCTLLWSAADAAKNAVIKVRSPGGCRLLVRGAEHRLGCARAASNGMVRKLLARAAGQSAGTKACFRPYCVPPFCSQASMRAPRRRRSATPAVTPSHPTSTHPAAGGGARPGCGRSNSSGSGTPSVPVPLPAKQGGARRLRCGVRWALRAAQRRPARSSMPCRSCAHSPQAPRDGRVLCARQLAGHAVQVRTQGWPGFGQEAGSAGSRPGGPRPWSADCASTGEPALGAGTVPSGLASLLPSIRGSSVRSPLRVHLRLAPCLAAGVAATTARPPSLAV